jgi:hypothetical protein
MDQKEREQIALQYAEKYGIVDYKINGNRMIYYANYPEYLNNPRYTIKVTVRLNTLKEDRQKLTYWNPKGNANMYK